MHHVLVGFVQLCMLQDNNFLATNMVDFDFCGQRERIIMKVWMNVSSIIEGDTLQVLVGTMCRQAFKTTGTCSVFF